MTPKLLAISSLVSPRNISSLSVSQSSRLGEPSKLEGASASQLVDELLASAEELGATPRP